MDRDVFIQVRNLVNSMPELRSFTGVCRDYCYSYASWRVGDRKVHPDADERYAGIPPHIQRAVQSQVDQLIPIDNSQPRQGSALAATPTAGKIVGLVRDDVIEYGRYGWTDGKWSALENSALRIYLRELQRADSGDVAKLLIEIAEFTPDEIMTEDELVYLVNEFILELEEWDNFDEIWAKTSSKLKSICSI